MKPIYVDLHIHTSNNADSLNQNYNVDLLLQKIQTKVNGDNYLISLTDHNTINKKAYISLYAKTRNILLGAELHIKYNENSSPYHCHIFIDYSNDIDSEIDIINAILDRLYPTKEITPDTPHVPSLEEIINAFDKYDFLLLPHGGQSHRTFDTAIPEGIVFDNTLERSIYYNQFDGFTARGNRGLERTKRYFNRLGISSFVNLVTGSDNYDPNVYPDPKVPDATDFVPTWMHALPEFNGLRISLSEESRFSYLADCPDNWSEHIKKVTLINDKIDIDVELTPGLNVVIGGSSSGKTLFVDSIARKINGTIDESIYSDFNVNSINIDNPSRNHPHYIPQNYITQIISDAKNLKSISDIDIIKNVFKGNSELDRRIDINFQKLRDDLGKLLNAVESIEDCLSTFNHIPIISRLITTGNSINNIITLLAPSIEITEQISYPQEQYNMDIDMLNRIHTYLANNPFTLSLDDSFQLIKDELEKAFHYFIFETSIRTIISGKKDELDAYLCQSSLEQRAKNADYERLIQTANKYSKALTQYKIALDSITNYSFTCQSQQIESMGHKLFITNEFFLSKTKLIDVMNNFLKAQFKLSADVEITPNLLFKGRYKERPLVSGYTDFKEKILEEFSKMNVKKYKIITKEGMEFDKLSAGWKTSILLDLVLGYGDDYAPLIIDQPEDNLANGYINTGLIHAIKGAKNKKQIIMVSHNATIPMLGDAQNIILCQNEEKIHIRSARLESKIDNKTMVDYIALITDGGKPSIKKRVKKYNLKRFKEED